MRNPPTVAQPAARPSSGPRIASSVAFWMAVSSLNGTPRKDPKNTRPGRGAANASTNSQLPLSTKASIRKLACSRMLSRLSSISRGLSDGPRALRHRVWYGGSISSGISLSPPSSLLRFGSNPWVVVKVL